MDRIKVGAIEYHAQERICESPQRMKKNYLRPGEKCRFERILEMIREGMSDQEICREFPEMDRFTLRVYHKAAEGKLTGGSHMLDEHGQGYRFHDNYLYTKEQLEEKRERMFEALDRGEWCKDAGARMGLNLSMSRTMYRLWRKESGRTTRQLRTELGLGGRRPGERKGI